MDKVVKQKLDKWITHWQSWYGANNQKRFKILTLDNGLFSGEGTIDKLLLILVQRINSLGDGLWTFIYVPERRMFLNDSWWLLSLAKPIGINSYYAIDEKLKIINLDVLWKKLGRDLLNNIASIYLNSNSLFIGFQKNYCYDIRFVDGCAYAGKRQR